VDDAPWVPTGAAACLTLTVCCVPPPFHLHTRACSVFPNCTAKAKGERQVYVGQQLLEARELGGMVLRRPCDRVSCRQLLLGVLRSPRCHETRSSCVSYI
jgi:hypothetical protein